MNFNMVFSKENKCCFESVSLRSRLLDIDAAENIKTYFFERGYNINGFNFHVGNSTITYSEDKPVIIDNITKRNVEIKFVGKYPSVKNDITRFLEAYKEIEFEQTILE